jgi:Uma2 family endonuclease
MATVSTPAVREKPFYIESDGKPMGETAQHVQNLLDLLGPLQSWFAADPQVLVAANMFVHYERGNRKRHISPDVFVVRGVPKEPKRRNYRVWEEGRAPNFVIEVTSKTTRDKDQTTKRTIYQDVLRVSEYFLFDPFEEYLHPRLQGYRLASGQYRAIRPVKGRLPSKVLGLHLEADGDLLRLYDPSADRWLPIPPEVEAERAAESEARIQAEAAQAAEAKARIQAEAGQAAEANARIQAEAAQAAEAKARQQAEAGQAAEAKARQHAEAETERLRRELEELRGRLPGVS